MKLKCMINGVEYTNVIPQGNTFSDEYNETLDSGTIILNHVEKISNLLPYDDVFIYDDTLEKSSFYRHLLVDNFTYERINFAPYKDNGKVYYTYKISLFSETKGLETVQLPNISITQPVKFGNKKTRSVWYYLEQFVEMYSPKIKVKKSESTDESESIDESGSTDKWDEWEYINKYTLDQSGDFKKIFENVYSPSFSLNNPNLRDVLAQLMLTKDMIPVVQDNIIKGMDITKRYDKFDQNGILSVVGSRTSENHCDALKRTYNNALSQENTCKTVEYIGFRNSDTALMTLENMRLETRFPIYKIAKIYLCCYKKGTFSRGDGTSSEHIFLCKHDITPLVKLNAERQLLSRDWQDFHEENPPKTINEMAEYRMMTVGYDIGSRYITGWGEKYQYIKNGITWWPYQNSYLQNIVSLIHEFNPLGIYSQTDMENFLGGQPNDIFYVSRNFLDAYVNPFKDGVISSGILGLKGLFFEVEYEGFYNGTVVHSKDDAYENIVMNDNSSSSLTLLEKDGLFQKEKVNRFANEAVTIRARYNSINDLQPLGSVFEDDIIIYHREYSIYDNFILATYYGTKDYVLKNYFTTVFAKHRPYNLLSYEESVRRSENKKIYLLFSKDNLLYENSNKIFDFDLSKVLSFYKPNPIVESGINYFSYPDKINYGYVKIDEKKYASDINVFVCGNSLCFNMAMYDNVSGGVYIKDKEPNVSLIDLDVNKDFSGSVQDWYMTVDDVETGFLQNVGFYFSHKDNKSYFNDKILSIDKEDDIKTTIYDRLFALPKLEDKDDETNKIGSDFVINKDNKELIDMTYQIEPISKSNDVFFSPWVMKLSDLFASFDKFNDDIDRSDIYAYTQKFVAYCATHIYTRYNLLGTEMEHINYGPFVLLSIPKMQFDNLNLEQVVTLKLEFDYDYRNGGFTWGYPEPLDDKNGVITRYNFIFDKIKDIKKSADGTPYSITLNGTKYVSTTDEYWNSSSITEKSETIKNSDMEFRQLTYFDETLKYKFSEIFGEDNYYFANTLLIEESENYIPKQLEMDSFSNNLYEKGWIASNAKNPADNTIGSGKENIYWIDYSDLNKTHSIDKIDNYQKVDFLVADKSDYITYNRNIFMVFGLENEGTIQKHLVYDEYEEMPEHLEISDLNVSEQISYVTDDSVPYLKITIPKQYNNIAYKPTSVQVWYFHEGSYKFVFGVNLTDEDKQKGYVKIYISAISNKDPRVFTGNKQILDGYVQNYLEDGAPEYGKGQYYKKIKKQ